MRRLFRKHNETELENVQDLLEEIFEPVAPRQGYIKDLSHRLASSSKSTIQVLTPHLPKINMSSPASVFWSVFGILSGMALVVLGIRTIVVLLTGLRAVYQKQM